MPLPYRSSVATALLILVMMVAQAQTTVPPPPRSAPKAEVGAPWQELTPAQRAALKPLERDWSGLDGSSKQKWLELSARVPAMSPDERNRLDGRMADWARLSPQERGRARLNFEEAKQVPAKDRQARWEAYQALPPEQKRALAERAVPPPPGRGDNATRRVGAPDRAERSEPQTKSNIVPNPTYAARPRPVAPAVMQAQPGATTTLISKRPSPPAHQQIGLPKIAATPGFVDRSTLLPQRGPQGAAARPSAASEPAASRRK